MPVAVVFGGGIARKSELPYARDHRALTLTKSSMNTVMPFPET